MLSFQRAHLLDREPENGRFRGEHDDEPLKEGNRLFSIKAIEIRSAIRTYHSGPVFLI